MTQNVLLFCCIGSEFFFFRRISTFECKPVQYDDVAERPISSHQFDGFANANTSRNDIDVEHIFKITRMSIWTAAPESRNWNSVIKIVENRSSRVTYPTLDPISWHRHYWLAHRDDRIPLWSIWMWATVAIRRLHHIFVQRFCHRNHSKLPASMPVKRKSDRLLETTVRIANANRQSQWSPKFGRRRGNASKIVKLLNWWYRKICTHFNGIDTSTQSNHNHANVGQCFCYVCPDPSTWACHHRHFSMPFIHFRSACFWFQCTMHLLGRTEHVNRNECFCGFSWRCFAACFARNDLIAKLFIHLDVWEKTKRCECLVDVFYTGVPLALTSNERRRKSIMHHCIRYKASATHYITHASCTWTRFVGSYIIWIYRIINPL